jgi:hypothetical protein
LSWKEKLSIKYHATEFINAKYRLWNSTKTNKSFSKFVQKKLAIEAIIAFVIISIYAFILSYYRIYDSFSWGMFIVMLVVAGFIALFDNNCMRLAIEKDAEYHMIEGKQDG